MSHGKNCELFSENILGRVVLFFAVAFFVVNSWADCVSIGGEWSSLEGSLGCYNQYPSTHTCYSGDINAISSSNPWYQNAGCSGGTRRCVQLSAEFVRCSFASGGNQVCNYSGLRCTSQCDVDSVQCVNDGMSWNDDPSAECGKSCGGQCPDPGAEEQCSEQGGVWAPYPDCECEIDSTDYCAVDRARCARLGGDFSGKVYNSPDGNCCSGVCNTCGTSSMKRVQDLKISSCCADGKYADTTSLCRTDLQSGCGVTYSSNVTNENGFCRDPNLDAASASIYAQQCSEQSSSSSEDDFSSSSEELSSSSECEGDDCGPGSSSGECEGDNCGSVSSSSESGSPNSSGSDPSQDGPYGDCEECSWLDSILDTLRSIRHLTSDIKLCLQVPGACPALDRPSFQFDTAFVKYLRPLMDSTIRIDSAQLKVLSKLDSNILKQLANDTVTWTKFDALGNIADTSLHSVNDTIRKWLNRIADSIGVSTDVLASRLDSIRNGFRSVDTLKDSAIYYFNQLLQSDSMYRQMFSDYQSSFDDAVTWLPGRTASAVGSALGYGDTASNTLRDDLKGIKGAIEGLGDGIGGNIAGSLDSAIRSGGGADTSGVSYGWLEHGERLGDSIKNSSGFGGLDFAGDSVMRDSLASLGYSCDNDSCCVGSECIYFDSDAMIEDSLTRYVNRMGDSINQHNKDYLEDSTTTLFQEVKDSLMAFNPLGIFDSTLLSTLGAKIPNSNTCPDHCSKFEVDIPFSFGTRHFTIDYGLCLGRAVFGNGNILSFLRFIIRLIIAITCISAVMWNASRIRR